MRRAKLSAAPASMQASGMLPGLVEQRLQGSLIKAVTGIAELAVHPDFAALFGQQREGILASQADQRVTRTLRRAAAAEAHRLLVEQAHILLMVQAVQYGAIVQGLQLLDGEGVGQGAQTIPGLLTGGRIGFPV